MRAIVIRGLAKKVERARISYYDDAAGAASFRGGIPAHLRVMVS